MGLLDIRQVIRKETTPSPQILELYMCGVLKEDEGGENNKDKPARIHLENATVKSKVRGKYYPLIQDGKMTSIDFKMTWS